VDQTCAFRNSKVYVVFSPEAPKYTNLKSNTIESIYRRSNPYFHNN